MHDNAYFCALAVIYYYALILYIAEYLCVQLDSFISYYIFSSDIFKTI